MPVLSSPSSWARGLVKSLKKRLHIKTITKRIADPFNKRIHNYASSSGKPGTKPKPGAKSKSNSKDSIPKNKSIGIQVSLPCRSILKELSHEGNVDVMSHVYGKNSNQNNSNFLSPSRPSPAGYQELSRNARTHGNISDNNSITSHSPKIKGLGVSLTFFCETEGCGC